MQNETDRLLAAKTAPTLADLMLARGAQLAGPSAAVAQTPAPVLTVVEDEAADDCASGSCQLARPGGICDCACGGAQHGARSTLAPAACKGTKMLVEVDPRGGYRYPRCPGCNDCRRPRLVLVGGSARDPFARIPQVDDEAW